MTQLTKWMTLSALSALTLAIGCATAASDADEIARGTGGTGDSGDALGSGGTTTTAGSTGGSASSSGGGTSLGGASSTGGTTGTGTGGTTVVLTGDCADKPALANGMTVETGTQALYTCTFAQNGCTADLKDVLALFECTASHAPNCAAQDPTGGDSWTLVGTCDELGMGGATGG